MQDIFKNTLSRWPKAVVFSDLNLLSKNLVLKFISDQCRVLVVTKQVSKWQDQFKENREVVSIVHTKDFEHDGFVDYVVLIDLKTEVTGSSPNTTKDDLLVANILAKNNSAKFLVVFSYKGSTELFNERKSFLDSSDLFLMTVYVGDLFSDKKALDKGSYLDSFMGEALSGRKVEISRNEQYFPVSPERVAGELVNTLFSFGYSKKDIAIISKPVSAIILFNEIIKNGVSPGLSLNDEPTHYIVANVDKKKYLKFDLRKMIEDLSVKRQIKSPVVIKKIKVISKNKINTHRKVAEKNIKRNFNLSNINAQLKENKSKNFFTNMKVLMLLLLIAFFMLAPLVLLILNLYSLRLAKSAYLEGNIKKSENYLHFAEGGSGFLTEYYLVMLKTPAIGKVYKYFEKESQLLHKTSELGETVLLVTKDFLSLSERILNDEPYDIDYFTKKTSLDLDYLYKQLGFFESDLVKNESLIVSRKINLKASDLKRARENVLQISKIISELPSLIGEDVSRDYLVLLQNENILRPTGGQIDALLVVSFNKGKNNGAFVLDTDSADNLLSGHVEPPYAIKKYLQKEEWTLKDSNWDADFLVSAQKAEWFLEKELGQSVHGVFTIDYEFLRSLLAESVLEEKNFMDLKISSNQDKVLDSKIKGPAMVLDTFIKQASLMNNQQKIEFARVLYDAISEKHIQVFFHNKNAQRAFSELNFTGEIQPTPCSLENCYSDLVGLVESDFSDNSFRSNLTRRVDITVNFEESLVKRNMIVTYENSSNPEYEEGSRYKGYLRIITNGDSGHAPVKTNTGSQVIAVPSDVVGLSGHKEIGISLEILPGETKTVVFSWESASMVDFSKEGEYLLNFRKQAGTNNDIIKAAVVFPGYLELKSKEPPSLTQGNTLIYNTEMLRDFNARIFW